MKSTIYAMLLTVAASCFLASAVQAQDITMTGKLESLKAIDSLHCVFDYSKLTIGEMGKEANYVKRKKAEAEKKEAGGGDKWEQAWLKDRTDHYQPKFIELFTKYYPAVTLGEYSDCRYQIIVKTLFIEPGFNVGVKRKNAMMNADVWIVDTTNPKKPLLKFHIEDAKGNGGGFNDFDSAQRIAACYAKAGKELAQMIAKKLKK